MRFILLPTYLKVAVIIAMFKQTKRRIDLNTGGALLAGEANNFKSQSQQKGMGLGAQVNL